MKSLIIYQSIHHGNTEKIAKVMSEILGARIIKSSEIKTEELENYDLIGFGSGIYFGRFHRSLIDFIKNLPKLQNKKAFIFSTSGLLRMKKIFHQALKTLLLERGFVVVGEFNCLGHDSVIGLLKYVGGFNRKRPNEKDLGKTREFAQKLISY